MRKLNESVIACYMAISLLVVFLPICLVADMDLGVAWTFTWLDWTLFTGISVVTILGQTFRFKAIAIHPLAGL
jgi:hypothetical protein